MSQTTICDPEFGDIAIRRVRTSKHIRIKIDHNGILRATLPERAAVRHIYDLLESSRLSLRQTLSAIEAKKPIFVDGSRIGASHRLVIQLAGTLKVSLKSPNIFVNIPIGSTAEEPRVQAAILPIVTKTLRVEAKAYLPRRLRYLADTHGLHYENVRFSSAGTRWGSCSSSGTISLNIWLMQLHHELIDYVILHELSHTLYMNHSDAFWQLLASFDPGYKAHKLELKKYHPSI